MGLLDEIFGGVPQIDPQMVAPLRRPPAPAPAPRPQPAPAPAPDFGGGIEGSDVLGAILQGMGGIAAPLGNLVSQQGAKGRQNQQRTEIYNWLVQQKDPNDASRTITPEMAKIIVTNEAIAKAYIPRILGTGKPSTEAATKGLPQGYMWADANDPSKGASRVPGVELDPTKSLSPAQKSLDQQFGKDYARFVTGGFADMQKGMDSLREVQGHLRAPGSFPNLTGPWTSFVPDSVGALIAPSSIEARERVEEVVQRNLREILGAQFTQKEGERLIARAYNPALDEETNAKRLDALIASMEKAYQSKVAAAKHFEQYGTLANYDGSLVTSAADIERDMEAILSSNKGGDAPKRASTPFAPRGGDPSISGQGGTPASSEARPDGARQAPDGNWYVPDPNRPGKYLRVVE